MSIIEFEKPCPYDKFIFEKTNQYQSRRHFLLVSMRFELSMLNSNKILNYNADVIAHGYKLIDMVRYIKNNVTGADGWLNRSQTSLGYIEFPQRVRVVYEHKHECHNGNIAIEKLVVLDPEYIWHLEREKNNRWLFKASYRIFKDERINVYVYEISADIDNPQFLIYNVFEEKFEYVSSKLCDFEYS